MNLLFGILIEMYDEVIYGKLFYEIAMRKLVQDSFTLFKVLIHI